MNGLSRRALLGATAGSAMAGLAIPAARAAAPFRNDLPPAWHRFRIGEFEATVISDGALPLGDPTQAFLGVEAGEVRRMLTGAFLPPGAATLAQNALVLNTGRQLVLFDTGMGDSMGEASRMFGPTTGQLLKNMRAAGIDPAQIDMVIATHAHCDHIWALVDANGNRNFPNAQVAISEADLRYWTDDANKRGPEFMTAFIDGARKNLAAYRDRMVMVRDGQEVIPGVTAVASPGHTVGHHCYIIASGDKVVMNTGDLAHHQVLLLRRPGLEFSFDTDPKLSAATRTRLLDRIATDRYGVLSYHFSWPGLGHVVREGEGYGWLPSPMNTTLVE
ncbi:MBL fold metallo-hydrolase [Muricoccus pecuniae]|uniref:Glyoxylase-like metal-dependent hydrolase (Beta-lactamase superfamily II) n=1 Tax=Muricoccus pecuniae TaxID=693023 RepID=A0A840Y2M2_9PROT|nr:MBL fold metallo-hydrolase [Roseomonas pecuniae]MBB5695348.1 glyoxylase-like metal-dependent hydrolase (beta-lactamase superfamily II) [Roseomonas pecuniae]